MIAGSLSVQFGGAVAVHAFTRSTPLAGALASAARVSAAQ